MSALFIYSAWLRAKRQLAEELQLNEDQQQILSKWFRQHVFEVGNEFVISKHQLELGKFDIRKYSKGEIIHRIAEELLTNGTYMQEETSDPLFVRLRTRVLVFGCPPLGVGPAKPFEKKEAPNE